MYGGFLKTEDPQVTMVVSIQKWSSMTWMMRGAPILENLHIEPSNKYDMKKLHSIY